MLLIKKEEQERHRWEEMTTGRMCNARGTT